jgi:hypothetical protein
MIKLKAVISATIIMLSINAVQALDMSVGVSCWYAWWSPMFENKMLNIQRYIDKIGQDVSDTGNSTTIKPSFLLGPVISIAITERLGLSSSIIYGPFYHATSEYSNVVAAYDISNTINDTMDITRYDSDTLVNYKVTDFFTLFMGFKYQGYRYRGTRHQLVDTAFTDYTYSGDYQVRSDAFGSGMGISVQKIIIENLFGIFSFSGVYLRSNITARGTQIADGTSYWIKDKDIIVSNVYGVNINPMVAYYISSTGITLMLGFRYQYLKYYVVDTDIDLTYNGSLNPATERTSESMMYDDYNKTTDRFWGVTFSALYSFSI